MARSGRQAGVQRALYIVSGPGIGIAGRSINSRTRVVLNEEVPATLMAGDAPTESFSCKASMESRLRAMDLS